MSNRTQSETSLYSVSKADFEKSFEEVLKIAVTSAVDLRNKFDRAKTIFSNTSEDWTKRHTQLKIVRSLIVNGEKLVDRPTMIGHLLQLSRCFEMGVKDLRSQILRETAITCGFLIRKYGTETHSIGEDILIPTMSQVTVSTKVMATSASTLPDFIVEKIMRQICELLKSAINDADSETRAAGRKAFAKLEEFHLEEEDVLYSGLEPSKQKMSRGGALKVTGGAG